MITISQAVKEIIGRSPFLAEALSEDIANVSQIARRIRPQVKKRLMEDVSEEAISMALHRMAHTMKPARSGFKFLKNVNDISVRSRLVEFTFPNPQDLLKVHQEILKRVEREKNIFLNISRGLLESIVIVSADLEKEVGMILKPYKGLSKISHLASITLKLPKETIMTTGVYYPILQILAWNDVNVIEIVSVGTELSIIVEEKDIDRAFSLITSLSATL